MMFGEMDKKVKTRRMNLSDCVFRCELKCSDAASLIRVKKMKPPKKNESRQAAAKLDLSQQPARRKWPA